jgi:hypothetical protein
MWCERGLAGFHGHNIMGGGGLFLGAMSKCVHSGEEISEVDNSFFGAKEISWNYVVLIVMFHIILVSETIGCSGCKPG